MYVFATTSKVQEGIIFFCILRYNNFPFSESSFFSTIRGWNQNLTKCRKRQRKVKIEVTPKISLSCEICIYGYWMHWDPIVFGYKADIRNCFSQLGVLPPHVCEHYWFYWYNYSQYTATVHRQPSPFWTLSPYPHLNKNLAQPQHLGCNFPVSVIKQR